MSKNKSYKGTLFQRGSVWYLEFTAKNADGQPVRIRESLGVANRKDAVIEATKRTQSLRLKTDAAKLENVLRERVASSRDQAAALEADRNRTPLADAWQRFPYIETTRGNARRPLKPRVIANNRQAWEGFTRWITATRPAARFVEDVTAADALAYSDYCRTDAKLGARGHNKRVEVCRVVFNIAGITPNPFAKIRNWTENQQHRDALEMADIQRITAAARGEYRLLIVVGIFTGLRLGDAINLQWQDIRAGRLWKKTAKTGKEVSLAVFPALSAELDKLERPTDGKGYIMPELAALYDRDATAVSKRMKRLFESCGIEVTEKQAGRAKAVSRRGFHCLRTTFVSICARAGVPVGAIAEWCGHSPEVNRIYQRWASKETDARILGALQGVAAATLPESVTAAAITVEAREITARERLLAKVEGMTEQQAAEWLSKMGE